MTSTVPSACGTLAAKEKHAPRIRFRSLALGALALAAVWLIYADAGSCDVLRIVSNRTRFHAIPVALSQLYHGRKHDYSAYRSIAVPFHGERPLAELLDQFSKPGVACDGAYYWTADDRGLSDYVCAAFLLFGPKVASFGKLYVVILTLSLLLFIVAHWRDAAALLLLVFCLCGIDVLVHVLPIGATVYTPSGDIWHEPIGLCESRIFDMLSFVAVLHLSLLACGRQPLTALRLGATVAQVALFVFLYHARSSLGWQVLAVGVLTTACVWRAWRSGGAWALALRPAVPLAILIAGLACLSAWKTIAYNRRYFAERGHRTFWHNALMGLTHPKLRAEYDLDVDDEKIVELVLKHMRRRNDPRLTVEWTTRTVLDSLGTGTAAIDWTVYEQVAREVYWEIGTAHPGLVLSSYLVCKPCGVASLLHQLARPAAAVHHAYRLQPFRPWPLAVVLAAIALVRTTDLRRNWRRHALLLACLLPFSLIPAVAFYPAVPTMMGFLTTVLIAVYLGVAWVVLRGRLWCRQHHRESAAPTDTAEVARAAMA
jgi:hypothetical protein